MLLPLGGIQAFGDILLQFIRPLALKRHRMGEEGGLEQEYQFISNGERFDLLFNPSASKGEGLSFINF